MRVLATAELTGRRILVVEDEYFLADDLKQMLLQQNAEVIGPAATIKEALRFVSDCQRIDCAVLDVNLGGRSVFPISEALTTRRIPFLFATGHDSSQIPETFTAIPRLEKPLAASALISALKSILGI
jgi:DNA-binding response OmpR family regulator